MLQYLLAFLQQKQISLISILQQIQQYPGASEICNWNQANQIPIIESWGQIKTWNKQMQQSYDQYGANNKNPQNQNKKNKITKP